MRALKLALCLLVLAIPALCSESVVRQRRTQAANVNGGMEYYNIYRVNLNQPYNLVANASLNGSSWNLAKPAWEIIVTKDTVASSPLQGSALSIIVDPSCESTLTSKLDFGVMTTKNQSMGLYTVFYSNSYSYPCPIGSWVYDPQNTVAAVYFYITVDAPQVPICPFTLKYATGPSPNSNCPTSTPQYPGGPVPNTAGSGGLSAGAIAGTAVGCCCAVVLVAALVIVARRRNASTGDSQPLTQQPQETGYQTGDTSTAHSST